MKISWGGNSYPIRLREQGFTIVELLIVIVVIGILAAISIVAYNGVQTRTHSAAVRSGLSNAKRKLEEYKVLNGKYPTDRSEFRAANLNFTLTSGRFAVYCATENSTTSNWALVIRPESNGQSQYITDSGGINNYTAHWDDATPICNRIGTTSPTASRWLKPAGTGPTR